MRLAMSSRRDRARGDGDSEEVLESSGWERRFEADVSRLDELVELYSSLGYEVRTRELLPAAFAPECRDCAVIACNRYVEVYTRRLP